jgi:hypothetical protein
MNGKRELKSKFRSRGTDILGSGKNGPKNMQEFLTNEVDTRKEVNEDEGKIRPEIRDGDRHKNTFTQNHRAASRETCVSGGQPRHPSILTERLHVQIRKDLSDKLIELVLIRKRDPSLKRRDATQRLIIEDALTEYFEKHFE